MDVVSTWTGSSACALQEALRLTNEGFADRLGVAVRTVAGWHAQPDVVPRAEIQAALDTAYERAGEQVRQRFALLSRPTVAAPTVQALRVAIAVVVRGTEVLLVCRRGDDAITWQFPAGVVKPGRSAEAVAVAETLGETGVRVAVRERLGSRLHPVTGVLADYVLCDYLAGDATNADPIENLDVAWAPLAALGRFIPPERIYPPVLTALQEAA
jgi:8-oxo-dGTP pyrophosphatase MutT (NUDIX family)